MRQYFVVACLLLCARVTTSIETTQTLLVVLAITQNNTPYSLKAYERLSLEGSIFSHVEQFGIRSIEHGTGDPRRALVDTSKERFELNFINEEKAHAFHKETLQNWTVSLGRNITASIIDVQVVVSNGPMDGVFVMKVALISVVCFLACIALFSWLYSIIVKHQRTTQAEKRLAEKFGQMYKRHIGVAH